ncbi:methyltransferase domain-containing protein [Ekhidna sp.]
MNEVENQEAYWTNRYRENLTGWDIGNPSFPLQSYIDQLTDKDLKILIPGAGNAYEAEYLFHQGFTNVFVLDISNVPLQQFKERVTDFPESHLIHGDFFDLNDTYDLIFEQTFFCSFEPTPKNRSAYSNQMHKLLNPEGKLVGVWFKHPLAKDSKRPFGGTKDEYLSYLTPHFEIHVFEDCYNSIPPRMSNELFGIFRRNS